MQVDTKQVILDYPMLDDDGEPLSAEPIPMPDGSRDMTFRDVVRMSLNAKLSEADNPPPEEKDRSYDIVMRVSTENPCDLSVEHDVPHILRYVGKYMGPLLRGRMMEILDTAKALRVVEDSPPMSGG